MQIRITWEGNDDGTGRILRLSSSAPRVWVFVEGPDGEAAAPDIKVRAHIRQQKHVRWLFPRYPFPKPGEVLCRPSPLVPPSFTIDRLPSAFLPYYLDLTVSLPNAVPRVPNVELKLGKASVYVVPRGSWLVSNFCLGLSALAAAYGAVLFWSLGPDRLQADFALWGATLAAIGTPLVPIVGPLFSNTLRRLAHNALTTSLLVLATLGLAACVRYKQAPIYFENRSSAPVELHKQIIVEPGDAAVVASADVEGELSAYIDGMRESGADGGAPSALAPPCASPAPSASVALSASAAPSASPSSTKTTSRRCSLKKDHPFRAANQCVVLKTDESCTELATASWLAKLQRWMSLGNTVYIGCRSVGEQAADYLDEWKRSGSCKRDPELQVTRGLKEHLERRAEKGATAVGAGGGFCVEPHAEVDVRPFRGSVEPEADLDLREVHLRWPGAMSGSLPSWRFSGNGKVSEVRLAPASHSDIDCGDVKGQSQQLSPYGRACDEGRDCAVLYAPRGQLIAKVQRGDQELGNLWCAAGASEIFAVRLRSRVKTFRVLAPGEGAGVRDVMSRYEVAAAGAGEWIFWCEEPKAAAAGNQASTLEFVGDVMLAADWQPDYGWSWLIPDESRIGKLVVQIDTHGQWGTLDCASRKDRTLHLLRGDLPTGDAFRKAWYPENERADNGKSTSPGNLLSTWTRYTETALYPSWVWYCAHDEPTRRLGVTTQDGSGTLTSTGTFVRSRGVPCLINPATGERDERPARLHAYNEQQKLEHSAFTRLQTWAQRGCDPARSYFSTIEGH